MIQARLTIAAVFACLLPAVWMPAQTPNPATTRPEFEVATIKPSSGDARISGIQIRPGGRLIGTNVSMRMLVIYAYNMNSSQVVGGPAWFGNDRYDVVVKADGKASPDDLRLMVQQMLADRLKLAVHREPEEGRIYELTPAKGGLKLIPAVAGSCQTPNRDHPPAPPTPGVPRPNVCGNIMMGHAQINAFGVPMARFADALASLLGQTVVDETGAAGTYNIHLEFTPDQATPGGPFGPDGPPDAAPAPDSAGPNIFTALQEQLGLRVESSIGQVVMLVIDHVERPSEN